MTTQLQDSIRDLQRKLSSLVRSSPSGLTAYERSGHSVVIVRTEHEEHAGAAHTESSRD